MIKRTKKICKTCETPQYIFSNGNCQRCANKGSSLKGGFIKPKPKKQKSNKVELDNYFVDKLILLNKTRVSEESGTRIPYPTRGNICHILPKYDHKSVAHHSENYVFLTWDEHANFDRLLMGHEFKKLQEQFPNTWKIMLKRLESVIPSCVEKSKLLSALEDFVNI